MLLFTKKQLNEITNSDIQLFKDPYMRLYLYKQVIPLTDHFDFTNLIDDIIKYPSYHQHISSFIDNSKTTPLIFGIIHKFNINKLIKLIDTNNGLLHIVDINDKTALLYGIEYNFNKLALKIINTKQSIHNHDYDALSLSIKQHINNIAIKLIENNDIKLDNVNKFDSTPLMDAIKSENEQISLILLKKNPNLAEFIDIDNSTPLIEAMGHKMDIVVLELLRTGKSNPKYMDIYNNTALSLAIKNSNLIEFETICIQLIQSNQFDPNYINDNDENYIMIAINKGIESIIIALFDSNKFDLKHKNKYNDTALTLAIKNKMYKIALYLVKTKKAIINTDELYLSIMVGLQDIVLIIIQTNQYDYKFVSSSSGETLLMLLIKYKMEQIALKYIKLSQNQKISESKIDRLLLDKIDNNGDTALSLSFRYVENQTPIAQSIEAICMAAVQQNCPLQYNMKNIISELIKTGNSNPGHINKSGNTILMIAILKNMDDIAMDILKTGQSKPEHVNNVGNTALLLSIQNNMTSIAFEIIKINPLLTRHIDNNGNTALIYAINNSMEDLALILIKTGHSIPEHKNNAGISALTIAMEYHMLKIAFELIKTDKFDKKYYSIWLKDMYDRSVIMMSKDEFLFYKKYTTMSQLDLISGLIIGNKLDYMNLQNLDKQDKKELVDHMFKNNLLVHMNNVDKISILNKLSLLFDDNDIKIKKLLMKAIKSYQN